MSCRAAIRLPIRAASSPAAFLVKVSPRIPSTLTCRLASSHTTREAMVSVFPLPAPATTSTGAMGASMTSTCCVVGCGRPSRPASISAE